MTSFMWWSVTRPDLLSPDALLTLQEHAVQDWLTQERIKSKILFTP